MNLSTKKGEFVRVFVLLAVAFVFIFFASNISKAALGVPTIISYQGRLSNASGNLLPTSGTSATFYFKFSIWDNATVGSGNRLWPIAVPATTTATVHQGVFNVNIGDVANGYPDLLDFNFNTSRDVYLQVEVSSDNNSSQTLSPRQRIAASSFAQLAAAVSGSTTPSSFGTTTPIGNSVVTIEATSTNALLLSLRAALNQIANLFQIQNSSGTNLFSVNNVGGLFASSTFQVTGAATFYGNTTWTSASTTSLTASQYFQAAGDFGLTVLSSGRVRLGTTTPSKLFAVHGDSLFSGDLSLANLIATGTTKFNGNTYTWPDTIENGNFLKTDGSGNLTWASVSSGAGSDVNWTFINTDGGFIRVSTSTNRVGIASSTPYAKLSISSDDIATTTLAIAPKSGQLANIIDIYNTSGALTTTLDANNLWKFGGGFISSASSSISSNFNISGPLSASSSLSVSGAVTFSTALTAANGGTGSTTLGGLLAGNGGQVISATTTSPLAWTLADGLTCTNCLNTATANGPLAITFSGSSYTFNASSSPYFGTLTASSTAHINTLLLDNALTVANGGTGITSYTPGDMLYASGIAKLSTFASSTDGFILSLQSGKPIWAATTTFSSPLSYTDGAVSCANCLSSATANGPLDIVQSTNAYTFNASSSPYLGTLFASSTVTLSGGQLDYRVSSTSTIPNLAINAWSIATSTSNTPVFTISYTSSPFGLIGIGTSSPSYTLSIAGNEYLAGGLGVGKATTTAGAIESSGLILAGGVFAALGTATSTFNGDINLPTGKCYQVNGSCISGGSGITSLNELTGGVQTFSANGPLAITSAGTVHTFNASSSPFFGTLFASSTVRFSNLGAGAVSANSLGVLSSGTLTAANGGTGLASYPPGDMLYASGIAKLSTFASSTDGFILSLQSGKPIWAATTTFSSPLSYADGAVSCTNCLNTATANGPLAITSSNSSYIFNASSSPSFGFLNATSTVTLSGGRTDYKTSSTSTIPNLAINAFSIATSTSNIPVLSISTSPSPFGLLGVRS